MDQEAIALILQGCQLAREVESDLRSLADHPRDLSERCAKIAEVFTAARDALLLVNLNINSGQQQLLAWPASPASSSRPAGYQILEASDSGGGRTSSPSSTSLSQRPSSSRTRNEGAAERRVIRVAAPQIGNTEIPPEDGFAWRKYGQKEIFGCRFPRAYYRCTHQKQYLCPAKKLVQRLDDDPYMFELTYRGVHTCHMSSTAPSSAPPPPLPLAAAGDQIQYPDGEAADVHQVADMADTMFNSGAINSMDFLFNSDNN